MEPGRRQGESRPGADRGVQVLGVTGINSTEQRHGLVGVEWTMEGPVQAMAGRLWRCERGEDLGRTGPLKK